MKSQRNRFLSCIPAVRFGLRKRAGIPHDGSVPINDQSEDNQRDVKACANVLLPAREDSPSAAVPIPATTPGAVPEVPAPDEAACSNRERAGMPARRPKVIPLESARSAQHSGQLRTEPKGPAVIIPFPPRGQFSPGRASLEPQAPQTVTAHRRRFCGASPQPLRKRQELSASFPRTGEAEVPAGLKRCRARPQVDQKGGGSTTMPVVPRTPTRKGKRRVRPPRENYAGKPAGTQGEPARLPNSHSPQQPSSTGGPGDYAERNRPRGRDP